jgi:hypothetical protein
MMEHWYKLLWKIYKEKDSLEEVDGINIKMYLSETGYEFIHRRI